MRSLRVAVLGGTGFVGRQICLRLHEAGHDVRIVSRRRESHRELLVLPRLQVVEGDVHDSATLRQHLGGMDAVINLVGILNGTRSQSFELVHAELPAKLVAACQRTRVFRLLHMSALPASTDAPSIYLRTKARGEAIVSDAESDDLHVTSFRPSVIFGPGDHLTNRFAGLMRMVPWVFPLACGNARIQPVHVDDVARTFVAALEDRSTFGQRYNLCGPEVMTLRQMVEQIAASRGIRRRVIPLGNWLSRFQAAILQFAPGRPFTPDNFKSLQVASICAGRFPEFANIRPRRFDDTLGLPAGSD